MNTYSIEFQEHDGSYNHKLLEAKCIEDARSYMENLPKCARIIEIEQR